MITEQAHAAGKTTRQYILDVLESVQRNSSRAAAAMGVQPAYLARAMKVEGIPGWKEFLASQSIL